VWVLYAEEEIIHIGCKTEILRMETVLGTQTLQVLNVE
jgi:hypothetical protein